ncbi:hypothetical protein [Streptomyces sp. NPDC008141]|uniref:hypothetical protein n=1 Tax=Streptomyces sp. NPDC008141 TaxID=3364815 RepID=UPI0036EF4BDD
MTDARSPMRALRAALFAAVCTALAAMGHSFMSGQDIPFAVLLPAFAVTATVAWLAGARRRGGLAIGAGVLTVQGVLHLLFSSAQPHTGGPAHSHEHSTSAGTMVADSTPPGSLSADTMAVDTTVDGLLGHSSGGMLAAHLLAAVLCALWLARGETAVFRVAAAVGTLAFTPLRLLLAVPALPEPPRPLARRRSDAVRSRSVVLGHTLVRRGPPALLAPRATAPGAAV